MESKKGKILTITSMKGGVGKTTTVMMLAKIYSKLDKKVLVLDLDLYNGNLAFAYNVKVKNSIYNLCDDMANNRLVNGVSDDYVYNVKITNIIEDTYESSINETLEVATQTTQTIEDASAKEQKGLLGLFSGIKDGITTTINKAETMLSNFIESVAVMIVTSCVIPILVIIFFLWISKIIFEIPIPIHEEKYFMLENPKQIETKE